MKKLIILIVCLLLVGCGTLRKSILEISEEEVKNAKTAREVAKNYIEIWPIQSGFIRAALGSRMDQLPTAATNAMKELDELCGISGDDQTAEKKEYTDKELGESLGLRVRMLNEAALEAVRLFAEDVYNELVAIGLVL